MILDQYASSLLSEPWFYWIANRAKKTSLIFSLWFSYFLTCTSAPSYFSCDSDSSLNFINANAFLIYLSSALFLYIPPWERNWYF